MKKIIVIIFLFFITQANSIERSDIEIKNGVFLEDISDFGNVEDKDISPPKGMFPDKYKSFPSKAKYSQEKLLLTFVKKKNVIDRIPAQMIISMGYFEFFYLNELKKNLSKIENFKNNYPNIGVNTRKEIQKIYSLNSARKSMREALGFTLKSDLKDVLDTYYVLFKLFEQGEKERIKLNKEEKLLFKNHKKLSKHIISNLRLYEKKNEQRIEDKKFEKEIKKNNKQILTALKKLSLNKVYSDFSNFENLLNHKEDLDFKISFYKFTDYLLKEIKKNVVKKRSKLNIEKADFTKFTENEILILSNISKEMKKISKKKSDEFQIHFLNLENHSFPAKKIINNLQLSNINLDSLNMSIDNPTTMKRWARKDWANAWKKSFPTELEDDNGIMIQLSEEDILSLKAQLSIEYLSSLLSKEEFSTIINDSHKLIEDLNIDNQSFKFSFGLDDYARFFGNFYNLDINNYSELTDLANEVHNKNWSPEEYASAYQDEVDLVNALQSGDISSFDAASLGAALGADLAEAAEVIAAASSAGVVVDLEAAAQGAGFDSFASAVAAYNAQYGTSYSVDEAKAALGQ